MPTQFHPLGSSSCCSAGEPIVGNIVNKVRRNRRQRKSQNESETKASDSSSTSLSSLLASSSKNTLNATNFPTILPQSAIPLEFGVINAEAAVSSSDQEQDVHQLIELCRRWRELSRKSRETNNKKSNK